MPDATSLFCRSDYSLPINLANISSGVYSAHAMIAAFHTFTFPLAIMLNILVIVAVKTKRPLRTKSNISLACLATTDFAVGLIVQPLNIIIFISIHIDGKTQTMTCTFIKVSTIIGQTCVTASLFHMFLISGERYLSIKHPFAYENGLVTEARIIMASGLAWMCALIIYNIDTNFFEGVEICLSVAVISAVVYFHIVIYKEVRRNARQIIANQVSLEEKEKLLKNRKAFNTTVVILLTLLLCYIPISIWVTIFISYSEKIPSDAGQVISSLFGFLVLLNSSINPLIYTVRIRQFRVTFIQMLTRKTFAQAEELENKIFGTNHVRIA